MRAMWSGHVAFGLVHIPVKMYAATEDRDVTFHQVHLEDGGRISYQRKCRTCDQVVPFSEIGKAYEDDSGRRVIVGDDELAALQVSLGRDIEIVEFVPSEQIDPIHFDRSYYLQPAAGAAKPYLLLRQALERTERSAVAMVTLRTRTRLALVRVTGAVLVLQTLLWPDEIRPADFAGVSDADVTVRPQELAMADSLVASLSADFDPNAHHDTYREAVLELVERKLAGDDVIIPAEAEGPQDKGTVIDLMAVLQESVRQAQQAKALSSGPGRRPQAPGRAAREDTAGEEPASAGDEPGTESPPSGEPTAAVPEPRPRPRPRKAARIR